MFMSKRGEESGNYYKFESSIKIWAIWFNWMISGLMMIKRKGFLRVNLNLVHCLIDFVLLPFLFCNLFCLLCLLTHKNSQLIKNINRNKNGTSSNSRSLYSVKYPPTSFTFFLSCSPTPLHSPHKNVSSETEMKRRRKPIFFTVSHPFSLLFI